MNRQFKIAINGVILAAIMALAAYLGVFFRIDQWAADALYQNPRATSGKIMVVGIDEKALEELGPFQTWTRDNVAAALEYLASDPDNMPAVVAIDTLYSGESGSPDADARLAQASLICAYRREESRGAHTRSDFPERSEAFRQTSVVRWDDAGVDHRFRPIPSSAAELDLDAWEA